MDVYKRPFFNFVGGFFFEYAIDFSPFFPFTHVISGAWVGWVLPLHFCILRFQFINRWNCDLDEHFMRVEGEWIEQIINTSMKQRLYTTLGEKQQYKGDVKGA